MVEFKAKADAIIKERWGIDVEHVSAETTYEQSFYKPVTKQASGFECRIGLNRGFPYQKGPWCQRDLKVAALNKIRKKNFEDDVFYRVRVRGKRKGEIAGWPMIRAADCQKTLKVSAIKSGKGVIQYLGIAVDEPNRFGQLCEEKKSPLVEAGWTEADCRRWCEKNDVRHRGRGLRPSPTIKETEHGN